ncbi:amino acid adenylation domain-containing protein [Microcoleus sp. FACHB-1515]|nr:amino acid adenylation domain-containing protein [Microcoleus sp. FACHB-1515]
MIAGKENYDSAEEVYIFPASFAQQRLWFIEQLVPEAALYTIPLVFRLKGSLDRSILEASLQAIIARHESLRTTFEFIDGQLMQTISASLQISLPLIDLQTLPATARESIALTEIRQAIEQPFDLHQGPLLRAKLWQIAAQEHLLLILLHHIIFDEWSSGVLIRELGAVYGAIANQQSVSLPELPIQYADFSHWQREWLQGEVLATQLAYWRQQLKDISTLNLPAAAPRRAVQSYQGAIQFLELPQSLLDAIEALSQQAETTLFMTLLAAFQTLLHRYSGQTNIAIGSPIANRHRSELEGLIGFLVNSLVLRSNLEGNPTFLELLDRVREVTLAAYAHQDLPFEKLVEELQPVRNLSQNPLFQVVFALQNTPIEQLELPGLTLSSIEFETKTTRFDLELYVWKCTDNFRNLWGTGWQQTDGLRGVIVYNTDLFEADAIAALRQHFQTLLEGIVANPNARLSALPLLTQQAQKALIDRWENTQSEYPTRLCIHQQVELQVEQRPESIALQFANQKFTYRSLNQGSNQLARYLQKLGVCAEMPVGICLQDTEAIAAMLAILKAGGAYVPLDASYPIDRLHFMLKDAQISIVLTQQQWADAFRIDSVNVICLEQEWAAIAQESEANLSIDCQPNQLAYVMYTSGSTGAAKGVMIPHRAVMRLVCETNYVQIESGDRIAQIANLAFDAATFEIWGALLNGATLIGIDRDTTLSPVAFATAIQQQNISILFLTTALLNQTASQVPDAFRSLKTLLFGGELANVDRVRSILQHGKPQRFIHVYGPTENTTFSTWYEVQNVLEDAATIAIGQAISNTQVYVLDASLNPVPSGAVGEIYLGGDGLAIGYLNRPELTVEKFILSPFDDSRIYKTGDRAFYRSDGNLEFLGRTDHQVKIRGFRIELGEIEAVLAQHPQVETAIVTVREIEGDRQLIAYFVANPASPSDRELRDFLKVKLPAYMLPAVFIKLDTLPLTVNGKVDQRSLPAPPITPLEAIQTAPQTTLEKSIAQIWTQLLGREVGIHDNFFERGGHSLLATQLVSRIRDRFQVELPLRSIFAAPTIAQLANQIEAVRAVQAAPMKIDRAAQRERTRREEVEL